MDIADLRRLAGTAMGHAPQRWLFKHRCGVTGPHGLPAAPWTNAVLRSESQVADSIAQVQSLDLPLASGPPKNWDALAALHLILSNTRRTARIFDAFDDTAVAVAVRLPAPDCWEYCFQHAHHAGPDCI